MRRDKTGSAKFKLMLGAVTLVLATTNALAQKMYKVVGDDGRVSYQDKPPETDNVSVEERHINLNSSRLSLTPPKQPEAAKSVQNGESADSTQSADDPRQSVQATPAAPDETLEKIATTDNPDSRDTDTGVDPDAAPTAQENATADKTLPEIKILNPQETSQASKQGAAARQSRNSRGRRPAPVKEQPAEKALSTDELAEIARSLNDKPDSD